LLKIQTFASYLKTIKTMLINFKEMAKNTSAKKDKMNEELKTLLTYMAPEFEKSFINELSENPDSTSYFSNTNNTQF
jgi:hypothetical protein